MNWLVKVAAFKVLSTLPGGPAVYRYSQERLTHSLVATPERVGQKIDLGLKYWDWISSRGQGTPHGAHLDFGAGWHPTIPLLYYSLGIQEQHLFDVGPLLNRKLIEETATVVRRIVTDPAWPHRARLQRLPEINWPADISLSDGLKRLGFQYHAPAVDAAEKLGGSIDFATSTQVLLHIPREGLRHHFGELHRLLKKGGKFLGTIYLWDLHATGQNGISKYNHLRYSPEVWEKWVNSRLMSYNRLKAADYRQLLEEAGFQIRHFDVTGPTELELEELAKIPVHSYFKRYSREELGATHLFFAAEKV